MLPAVGAVFKGGVFQVVDLYHKGPVALRQEGAAVSSYFQRESTIQGHVFCPALHLDTAAYGPPGEGDEVFRRWLAPREI